MEKERITIIMSKSTLDRIDSMIDGSSLRNRSHVIEHLLLKGMGEKSLESCVILAGGKDTSKALMTIKGFPVIYHQLKMLENQGIKKVFLCINSNDTAIRDSVNNIKTSMNVVFSEDDKMMGTAGSVYKLRNSLNENFIVINVDTLSNFDIKGIHRFHMDHDAIITMLLKPEADLSKSGSVSIQGSRIISFTEKLKKPDASLANAGVYIMSPKVFDYMRKGFMMLETDVFPKIAESGNMYGYTTNEKFFDIGTDQGRRMAEIEW